MMTFNHSITGQKIVTYSQTTKCAITCALMKGLIDLVEQKEIQNPGKVI